MEQQSKTSRRVASHDSELSAPERAALKVFSDFQVGPGKMFCFTGPLLDKHQRSLALLVDKELVIKEGFAGGYSLSPAGNRAMLSAVRASR